MKNIKAFTAILTFALLTMTAFGQEQTAQTTENQTAATQEIAPKKEGVIRIGIVAPKTQIKQSDEAAAQEVSEPIRQLLISYLNGPTIETISIEARTPAQISVEAGQKSCDFVLYSSVTQKQKTSIFGNLIKIAVPVLASSIPGAEGDAQSSNMIDGAAQQSAQTMANAVANSVKAKDVFTLSVVLSPIGGTTSPVLNKAFKGKANSDSQDVLSPLVEQAAAVVAEAITSK